MSPVEGRSISKAGSSASSSASPLPRWIPPQLVETAPPGPQWLHEIKLDGFRMPARIERGRVQLLTPTGLDWSHKYPSVVEALVKVGAKTLAITPQSGCQPVGSSPHADLPERLHHLVCRNALAHSKSVKCLIRPARPWSAARSSVRRL